MEIQKEMAISPDDAVYYVLNVIQGIVFYIKYSWNHEVYDLGCDTVDNFLSCIGSAAYDESLEYLFENENLIGLL